MSRRIVSFLPSATEMAFALGLGDQVLGVTHECDYPTEARTRPVVVRGVLPVERMTQREIDAAVTERLQQGLSLYAIDEAALREAAPDLILTQELCEVCAPSGNEISETLKLLPSRPDILWLTPRTIEQIFDNLTQLAAATGRETAASDLIAASRDRLEHVRHIAASADSRPRVFCMEWIDPLFCSGHWVPEMVAIAGGIDALGRTGTDSVRIQWQDVLNWAPEVLIVAPCGFNLEQTIRHAAQLHAFPGWSAIPAVRNGRVYAVDANAYFARPGPRVVDGCELLAHLIHPDLFAWRDPPGQERSPAFRRLDQLSDEADAMTVAANAV
jgi:iron complex transport system substrate-binding protein